MAMERKKYPIRAEDYQLLEAVGQGVSAAVHRALCIPLNEVVAIKILDFERKNCDLSNVSREAQTMILIDHPNVLKAHCSFVHDHTLWVVMPYMAGGSCLHILKLGYPNGFEEPVIATVLREVLKGLEYLHRHGHIHRDLKAGNILVDARGGIKLGDFGVSANLFDSGERQRTRNTLAGTPCWMAPEVLEQLHGHDFKADIWSFGITALELAHGHAPFSKYPPMKVLLMTLQNAPPGLDYEQDKKFTASFKQMIAMCLVKDPSKRPTAQKLLKQPFFKQARSNEYICRKILEGLPSLGARHKALKDKEEDLLAQKKMPDGKMEEISQNEYKRGISGWNFDIEDLKAQASLIPHNDDTSSLKPEGCLSALMDLDTMQEKMQEGMTYSRSCSLNGDLDTECDVMLWNKFSCSPLEQPTCYQRSDGTDNELKAAGSSDQNVLQHGMHLNGNDTETCTRENCEYELNEKHLEVLPTLSSHRRKVSTSSCVPDIFPASKEESVKQQNQLQPIGICNGVSDIPIDAVTKACKSSTSNADDLDDKLKIPVIQQKGRFKVTSENVELEKGLPPLGLTKSQSLQVFSPFSTTSLPSPGDTPTNPPTSSLFPQLHCILQANILQRDNILNLMRQVSTGDGTVCRSIEGMCTPTPSSLTEKSLLEAAYERDKELVLEVADLQWRLVCLQDELQKLKARNAQV